MRGSQIGWYWVKSALPLTTWLPPANTMRDQLKLLPLIVDEVEGKVLPDASIVPPAATVPALMAEPRSVRKTLASFTAPSTFNSPAPCCSRLAPASGCAVYCRIALMSGGVRPGFACSINAAAPATAGAAIDVPLSCICVSPQVAVMPSGVTSVLA